MSKVNESMTIMDVLNMDPGVAPIFMKHGLACLGCPGATMESIADAGQVHGIDVSKLVSELNEYLEKAEA
ncbi:MULTISPECIES: DUF1858 domain-containing protein [Tindallia]|uniref:Hybrid cluster protein-associated redox disulfide domain-containing protein n=2 Tax=Tindallia TaxID=69894 RepID=A0A1H3QI22_9FIRM|nr:MULTISPECIES: DUF1858 domain-containing protein [Tindallia]SDZ13234.1 hybrid cluster protein-associated redox disulfide domain-containing protein [Tindallia californiensis]SFI22532.1 hybrid cluster protein-associated redox disulfide domain-containing protein [Tindallia magadiensis]